MPSQRRFSADMNFAQVFWKNFNRKVFVEGDVGKSKHTSSKSDDPAAPHIVIRQSWRDAKSPWGWKYRTGIPSEWYSATAGVGFIP